MHIFTVDNVFRVARRVFGPRNADFARTKVGRLTQTLTGIYDIVWIDKYSIHWFFVSIAYSLILLSFSGTDAQQVTRATKQKKKEKREKKSF